MNLANATTSSFASNLVSQLGSNSQLKLYSSAMSSPDVAETGNLLATITIPSWSASGATVTSAAANATVTTSGTVASARLTTSGGAAVLDLNYGTDFTLANATINANTTVAFASITVTVSQ